jgi:mono/diheme cytochrome c family protein
LVILRNADGIRWHTGTVVERLYGGKEIMSRRFLWIVIFAPIVGICGVESPVSALKDGIPATLGISFIEGSTSTLLLKRDGRTYVVDLVAHTARETDPPQAGASPADASVAASPSHFANQSQGAAVFHRHCASCHGPDGKGNASIHTPNLTDPKWQASLTDEQILTTIKNGRPGTIMPAWDGKLSGEEIHAVESYIRALGSPGPAPAQAAGQPPASAQKNTIYEPGDDSLLTLPTGRRLDPQGLYVNFAHRFAFDPAFSGPARGGALLGLDGFALSSFGLRYGVSQNFSVSVYRSPSFIARPIQIMAAYNFLSESEGAILNAAARFSVEGQNDFDRNFAESFELILSRSLSHRAQIYFVPTFSLNARHLFSPSSYQSGAFPSLPGYNTFSAGVGGAFDIRPTVALVAEVIPTLVNGRPLGIHRPAYAFGIQKKIWRHAFTIGFTTAPATTVSQRAGTRAAFLNEPNADKPSGLFIGFDLTRQLR